MKLLAVLLMSFFTNAQSINLVEDNVEEVNTLRETLVKGVSSVKKVDKKTFKAVCAPVGRLAKKRSDMMKTPIRQASHKNRNPKNAATGIEMKAIEYFQENDNKTRFWQETKNADHYFRKIVVKKECLACHGEKSKRPDFVVKGYPKDKAFGFKIGDIRGVYHVEVIKPK